MTAIPAKILERATPESPLNLNNTAGVSFPFHAVVRAYYPNAILVRPDSDPRFASLPKATAGMGVRALAVPVATTWKNNEQNWPAAYVEIDDPQSGMAPRTWLLSAQIGESQTFEHNGRQWRMELRPVRRYTDFSLTLLKVTHDIYAGSNIPKNYASLVLLRAPGDPAGREVRIHMNAPLRHGGLAFYQYQMSADAGESVLQVVSNPSWQIPYIACALMTIGLLVQFGISLVRFGGRSSATPQRTDRDPSATASQSSALQRKQEAVK